MKINILDKGKTPYKTPVTRRFIRGLFGATDQD